VRSIAPGVGPLTLYPITGEVALELGPPARLGGSPSAVWPIGRRPFESAATAIAVARRGPQPVTTTSQSAMSTTASATIAKPEPLIAVCLYVQ
jgi:hypothetical protein